MCLIQSSAVVQLWFYRCPWRHQLFNNVHIWGVSSVVRCSLIKHFASGRHCHGRKWHDTVPPTPESHTQGWHTCHLQLFTQYLHILLSGKSLSSWMALIVYLLPLNNRLLTAFIKNSCLIYPMQNTFRLWLKYSSLFSYCFHWHKAALLFIQPSTPLASSLTRGVALSHPLLLSKTIPRFCGLKSLVSVMSNALR